MPGLRRSPVYLLILFSLLSCQSEQLLEENKPPANFSTGTAIEPAKPLDPINAESAAASSAVQQSEVPASEEAVASAPLDLTLPKEDADGLAEDTFEFGIPEEKSNLPDFFNVPEEIPRTEMRSKLLTNDQPFDSKEPHKSLEMIDGAEVTIERRL